MSSRLFPIGVSKPLTLLLVEDEDTLRGYLADYLSRRFQVQEAATIKEAEEILADKEIAVILSDHELPGSRTGLDFLGDVRVSHPHIPRLMMTGRTEAEIAVNAINDGEVLRFVPKPFELSVIDEVMDLALEERENHLKAAAHAKENSVLRDKIRSMPYLGRRIRSVGDAAFTTMGKSVLSAVLGSAACLAIGIATLLILYAVKSALGIQFTDVPQIIMKSEPGG